jgi:hypothetical protein
MRFFSTRRREFRPTIAIAAARSEGQGRRFFSAAEGSSLTDASTAIGEGLHLWRPASGKAESNAKRFSHD